MENKNEENESKTIPGHFDCIVGKTDRYGRNKTQTF